MTVRIWTHAVIPWKFTRMTPTARAAPEVARDATRDEMRFIDHAGSMLAMFRLAD